VQSYDLSVGVATAAQRGKNAERRLGPGDVDSVEIGGLGDHALRDFLPAGGVRHPRLGHDLHVRIVLLDGRLEGAVALVGDVEVRIGEKVADLTLASESSG